MHIQLENVVEMGTERIYTLDLSDIGMHLIHVTNAGGSPDYSGGTIQHFNMTDQSTRQYADEVAEGEQKLPNDQMTELSQDEHSYFITFPEIRRFKFESENPYRLRLWTDKGNFAFVFTSTPEPHVEKFVDELMRGVQDEQTANQVSSGGDERNAR